jgi:hypothetical protein
LAELRHLLDPACLSFLGMLPTFTGFSHGVNQSSDAKKASLLPALFPFVLLNFEAQAKCDHDERERNTMSNSASDDNNRPTPTSVGAQPDTDTAIAAFVSELQQAWDQRDASISNRHFAADLGWGSPYGATVNGYNQLHAIHTRLKQQGTGGAASRYEIKRAFAVSDDVIICSRRALRAGEDMNEHWLKYARPIAEAFWHTKFFLEMLADAGLGIKFVPAGVIPFNWAAILSLYQIQA